MEHVTCMEETRNTNFN